MFYVLIQLRAFLREKGWFKQHGAKEPNFAELLDLVALGTVADVVPLDRNNRILVEQGLRRIRAAQCCAGIKALLQIAKVDITRAVASDLGFYAGPRINAAGRLQDMSMGIECLLCADQEIADDIAETLHELNAERRLIESQMQEEALKSLAILDNDPSVLDQKNAKGICIYQADWHEGVVGILAARIKEKYYRPTIAFTNSSEHELKGSARSIPGVHIRDVLDTVAARNPGLISKFGGHAMAAGLSLSVDNYAAFCKAFAEVLEEWLTEEDLQAEILSDGELHDADFAIETARMLRNSGPWGQAFPAPIFDGEFKVLAQRVVGEKHLKLKLQTKDSQQEIDAIAFNYENFAWHEHAVQVHAAYQLDVNLYQGIESAQLLIRHLEVIE
jgi:single-stranded-DNA-specific exonuclease